MYQSVMDRAKDHPDVLEIMADCADAIETENSSMHDHETMGPYDGDHWLIYARELRDKAAKIRAEDPELWSAVPFHAFTLDQLAHFDRCLFPDTLLDGLVKHGVDADEAHSIVSMVNRKRRNGGKFGTIDIYQEYIQHPAITGALSAMVAEFLSSP
jgi:hypothetical protein